MANQALQNLRKIHELQKEGEISKILKDIRSSKSIVENFSNQLSARKKQIDSEAKALESVKVEPEKTAVEVKTPEPASINEKPQEKTNFKKFDVKSERPDNRNNSQNRFNRPDNRASKPDFNRDKKDNKPFNSFNKQGGKSLGITTLYHLKEIISVHLQVMTFLK